MYVYVYMYDVLEEHTVHAGVCWCVVLCCAGLLCGDSEDHANHDGQVVADPRS